MQYSTTVVGGGTRLKNEKSLHKPLLSMTSMPTKMEKVVNTKMLKGKSPITDFIPCMYMPFA
jgi:hypothetical protein